MVEGCRVTAPSHFPTLRLSHVGVGSGSARGRRYFEVPRLTGGLMWLGRAGPLFQCSPTRGQGVGDRMLSWAFVGGSGQNRWRASSAPYGRRWSPGYLARVGRFRFTSDTRNRAQQPLPVPESGQRRTASIPQSHKCHAQGPPFHRQRPHPWAAATKCFQRSSRDSAAPLPRRLSYVSLLQLRPLHSAMPGPS